MGFVERWSLSLKQKHGVVHPRGMVPIGDCAV